ncbi:hypothetical protein [Streptomyces sp. NPDC046759]|uniref:hypothetical protein n=1 Tax=Streptomyces sp. NPDC046759 TaxID=3155019 RepID=UPI00340CC0E4
MNGEWIKEIDSPNVDVDARVKAWHETREDLLAHEVEPWTLILRTNMPSPSESARAIVEALSQGAPAEPRNARELVG